jgi:predicted SnoaL-like aldol condensation-catalyzing enzyme
MQFPNKYFNVKNILADGDLVATHSHLAFKEGEPGMIVVHLFRFKDGKIVEMWDCGQPIQANSPNTDGAF